ncbi:acyltransferase [Lysobacter sp. S4-A87]|uniref:LpxL/LpxP family acyltransferase n=1 Tax=Lysobacter sp. S4-A87 TaxID=2925843 RepID=UPI001F535A3C|nr:acyltransferase [Lysobacter sp. S4-A87]UNK48445.1 acyltransferase [Lysobacter sp. S4-A87]
MNAHWKQRPEGGSRFAIWLIRSIARYGGRAVARLCLYPITAYFLLVRGPERRASRDYLARVLQRPPAWWNVARHVHTFASTILDRVFLLSGQLSRFDIRVEGLEALARRVDRGEGVLVFGSHLGSFDALRVLVTTRPSLRVRIVLDISHNPALTQLLDALNPRLARDVIDAGQDGVAIVLAIQQALAAGELVALLVDRAAPGETVTRVPFLGDDAPFPNAPWLIAATLQVPVVLAFGLYRGGNRYDLRFAEFSDGRDTLRQHVSRKDRRDAVTAQVRRYAALLQEQVRGAPYNWFNFYDFWDGDDAADEEQAQQQRGRVGAATGTGVDAGQRDALRSRT